MKKLPSKVTLEDIDHILAQSKVEFNVLGGKLTHCMITLPSEFIVTGESSCVDPAEYKKELGECFAKERAVQTLWMLEGYELSNKRMESKARENRFTDMCFRSAELSTIVRTVDNELKAGKPDDVSPAQWAELEKHMYYLSKSLICLDTIINLAREPELAEGVGK